jgi:ABC-type multidrug transport system ATPase subunit
MLHIQIMLLSNPPSSVFIRVWLSINTSYHLIHLRFEDHLSKDKEKDDKMNAEKRNDDLSEVRESRIVVRKLTAIRMPDAVILKEISFDLTQPGLVLILGGNASGKTSLMLSILNELTFKTGSAQILSENNCSAYSGHEPWIINATARENILMASPLREGEDDAEREVRYLRAVKDCCLVHDFNSWTDSDETLIGEKGINISGGQRQRISLARALCSDASVFLLDAPMSGLDVVVASHVFSQAIKKASQKQLVVMTDCTYKQSILAQADHIIALEEGEVVFEGTYEELLSTNLTTLNVADQENSKDFISHRDEETDRTIATSSCNESGSMGSMLDGNKILTNIDKQEAILGEPPKNKKSAEKSSRNKKSDDISITTRPVDTYLNYARSCGLQNLATALALSIGTFSLSIFACFK